MTMRSIFALLVPVAVSACALTSKAPPLEIHYYSPPPSGAPSEVGAPRPTAATPASAVSLGRITSSASLRSRIAHRKSEVELGLYDTRRWTDDPEVFVRRALEHRLFDQGAFRRATDGRQPTLDVEVIAFEEGRTSSGPTGRITLRYQLHGEQAVFADGIVDVERPARKEGFDSIVVAISEALDQAAARLVIVVDQALAGDAGTGAR
jgi:cholesterol transport system auxiliary component